MTFGPTGFDAYARLRLLPDPVRPGQSENDVEADGRADQLPTLFEVLAARTTTPDDWWFCVWEGFAQGEPAVDDAAYLDDEHAGTRLERADARPGLAPRRAAAPAVRRVPRVVVPNRAYWLFRGPLADVGAWDTARGRPGWPRLDGASPAFVWPADHAWCVAQDVDPHWAGIGGDQLLIERLVADPRLDVVLADPAEEQPSYR